MVLTASITGFHPVGSGSNPDIRSSSLKDQCWCSSVGRATDL